MHDNILSGTQPTRATRPISWVRDAQRDFGEFPDEVRADCARSLTIAAEGDKAENAKPMGGLGSGVFEIVASFRGNAYRTVYAVQAGKALWVVHAFQKKSTHGNKTPKREVDLIRQRLKRLKEEIR